MVDLSDVHIPTAMGKGASVPFGPYKDFAACVAANKDKDSPEGYCAATHKKITGKFPQEMSEEAASDVEVALGGIDPEFFTDEALDLVFDVLHTDFDEDDEPVVEELSDDEDEEDFQDEPTVRVRLPSGEIRTIGLKDLPKEDQERFRRASRAIERKVGGGKKGKESKKETFKVRVHGAKGHAIVLRISADSEDDAKAEAIKRAGKTKLTPPFKASIAGSGGSGALKRLATGKGLLGLGAKASVAAGVAIGAAPTVIKAIAKSRRSFNESLFEQGAVAKKRFVMGVEAFSPGTHIDSQGNSRNWTHDEMNYMVGAFAKGIPGDVPVKLGHSSPEHNDAIAKALGLPMEVLQGDGGTGMARLGQVSGVNFNGDKLTVDMELHEKVASLVEDEFFNSVSLEILHQDDGPVISGIALLGGQRPALKDLAPLQEATLLEDGTKPAMLLFEAKVHTPPKFYKFNESGQIHIPMPEATAEGKKDGHKVWDVPINDPGRNRRIIATVSAPDEVSAGRIGLRVTENFLLSATGPLGTVLGTIAGVVLGRRLLSGKPLLNVGGVVGRLKWFEEDSKLSANFGIEQTRQALNAIIVAVANGAISQSQALRQIGEVREGIETDEEETLAHKVIRFLRRRDPSEPPHPEDANVLLQEFEEYMKKPLNFEVEQTRRALKEILGSLTDGAINPGQALGMVAQVDIEQEDEKSLIAKAIRFIRSIDPSIPFQEEAKALMAKFDEHGTWTVVTSEGRALHVSGDTEEEAKESAKGSLKEGETIKSASRTSVSSVSKEEEQMKGELTKVLGLHESASESDVVAAVTKLTSGQGGSSFAEVNTRLKAVEEENKILKHNSRVSHYREEVTGIKAIPGTPTELANKLVKMEESAGTETAEDILKAWKETDVKAKSLGIFSASLSNGNATDEGTFMGEVKKYQEENKDTTFTQAYEHVRKDKPDLWNDYSDLVKGEPTKA